MGWTGTKTDWEIKPYVNGRYQGDWFNVGDYNRIAGNLRYLHIAGQNILSVSFAIPSINGQSLNGFPHASDMNALEDALYAITQNVYAPGGYTGKNTWSGNGATPTVDDLNRIEQACATIYAYFGGIADNALFTSGGEPLVDSEGDTLRVR